MNQSLDINASLQQIKSLVGKTHYILLLLFVTLIIVVNIVSVTNMLNTPATTTNDQPTATNTASSANFAKDPTIPKISELEFSSSDANINLPSGQRINPFSE